MMGMNTGKKVLGGLKNLVKSHEFAGQGLAQIPKVAISLTATELGNKIISTIIGVAGNIVNEGFNKKQKSKLLLRSFFTNLMFTFADPTANQIREMGRNASDLIAGIKGKSFGTAFGAIIEEPAEIVGAIRSIIPRTRGITLSGLKSKFAGFQHRSVTQDSGITEVTPGSIATQVTSFDSGISPVIANDMSIY